MGKARLSVLDCYTCLPTIDSKEIVGYNRLELRARYKFESYEYVDVCTAMGLVFEIYPINAEGKFLLWSICGHTFLAP